MSTAMTRREREAFLADTHVGIVAVAEPGRGPLMVSIWYGYEPGGVVRFVTGASSRKVRLLRAAGRAALCAQSEAPPYRSVCVEGPVTISTPDPERDVRATALRYLGPEMGQRFLDSFADVEEDEQVLVTLTPEHWVTYDGAKLGL
jgi:PPOX class probable F420-dependent enzyme